MDPLILNFDDSVHLTNAKSIALAQFQEEIRFGCGMKRFTELTEYLDGTMPQEYGTVFIGSGDYHHISTYLIQRLTRKIAEPFQVVVFDNHPDNMRFPFGIHCGSWISHIAKLPCVSHIHVVGITSADVALKHAWETRLMPFIRKKLTNWCINVKTDWANTIGLGAGFKSFDSRENMMNALQNTLCQNTMPTYLSIDKDALSPNVVKTNWDQGVLLEEDITAIVQILKSNLIGSDVTGEVSIYAYKTWWKRLLSGLDEQVEISTDDIIDWQMTQNQFNERLLKILNF